MIKYGDEHQQNQSLASSAHNQIWPQMTVSSLQPHLLIHMGLQDMPRIVFFKDDARMAQGTFHYYCHVLKKNKLDLHS